MYRTVYNWNLAAETPCRKDIGLPTIGERRTLMKALIDEEHQELHDALEAEDLPKTVDALLDLVWVTLHGLMECGLRPDDVYEVWDEVKRANESKVYGEGLPLRNDNGKIQKPPGFCPPDIEGVLERLMEMRDAD